jgi:outer membrane protein assembly factor BamB
VQGGKDALLRVLDRRNLSGKGGPRHVGGGLQTIPTPGGCALLTQPTVWTDPASQAVWVFVDDDCAMGAYQVVTNAAGSTTLQRAWMVNVKATMPIIAGNVLFAATSGAVLALDPRTGTQLWSSVGQHAGGSIGGIHWESPLGANGVLYCADENGHLTAYGI